MCTLKSGTNTSSHINKFIDTFNRTRVTHTYTHTITVTHTYSHTYIYKKSWDMREKTCMILYITQHMKYIINNDGDDENDEYKYIYKYINIMKSKQIINMKKSI